MKIEGGCYCGAVRYAAEAEPQLRAQCHCRECQYISGGGPNPVMGLPDAAFHYVKGTPKRFSRSDLPSPVTREFCGDCGTPLTSRTPAIPGMVLLKAGSLDQTSIFGKPDFAVFTIDKPSWHGVVEGLPGFERMPG
ncbi:GFA family protein [Nevskia sp.]|uniref:GFA family protein n=1 Tax=Nevskia sp. TaxID=1929292 RepID=UPI0025E5BB4A|nr:GFA family protein [Nevskia sp.]